MADVATAKPNGAAAATATKSKAPINRVEKPDEEKYKKDLEKAEKEHAAAQDKLNKIKEKVKLATPQNKDTPQAKRQEELRSELSAIRQKQQGAKSSRGVTFDKIKSLEERIKSKQAELKTARGRVPYKSVQDIDNEIERLQREVDTGKMKIVDEKKALNEISLLNRQRKGFGGLEQQQKDIDKLKAEVSELRKSLDDPESKALSDRYTAIQKELDGLKAEQDGAYKNLNALRDERTKLQGEQNEKYQAIRALKDRYFGQRRAYREYQDEIYKQRREREKAEKDAYEKEKRRKIAEQKLEEASAPAYQDLILSAEGLIRFFDPTAIAEKATESAGKFAASAQRTVSDDAFKGMKVVKKDEEDYFVGGAGKKGKKGKKGPAKESFNIDIGVIEQLSRIGVETPTNQAAIPGVVEKLKEKIAFWKEDQDRKTKENVSKAQKEIDNLETEAKAAAQHGSKDTHKKPAQHNAGVNGKVDANAELAQEKDAADDAAKELEKAKLEDVKEA